MKSSSILLLLSLPVLLYCNITAARAQNYVDLEASKVNLIGGVRLTYRCDFSTYDYQGVAVDIYLAAIHDPIISDGPSSVSDLLSSGGVQLFRPGMRSTYTFTGRFALPTFSNVVFPPAPTDGSLVIDTVSTNTYEGNYALAAVFTHHGSADFIRTDGFPAANSNTFTPFQYHAVVLARTIHMGDGYDPYMANWEVPYPEGKEVARTFVLNPAPQGQAVLRGSYWGTYYTTNPIYINEMLVGYIPGQFNGNHWSRSYFRVPGSFFRQGTNLVTFKCSLYGATGHWDNYMAKGWELFYN